MLYRILAGAAVLFCLLSPAPFASAASVWPEQPRFAPLVHPVADGPCKLYPWLHDGFRLNYHTSSAIITDPNIPFVEDQHGQWINPDTHEPMSRNVGEGSIGINQLNFLRVAPDALVEFTQSYTFKDLIHPGVPPTAGVTMAFLAAPDGQMGENLMLPAKLAALASVPGTGVVVSHVPFKMDDQTRDCIRVDVTTADAYNAQVYDLQSGVLVHFSSRQIIDYKGAKAMQCVLGDLLSARTPNIPWAGEPITPAVANLHKLHWAGEINLFTPGVPPHPMPCQVETTVMARGDGWMSGQQVTTVANNPPGAPDKCVWGAACYCGLWIGPQGSAPLQTGQVLDEDPDTGCRTFVSAADEASITITIANSTGSLDTRFSRSDGLVMAARMRDNKQRLQITNVVRGRE